MYDDMNFLSEFFASKVWKMLLRLETIKNKNIKRFLEHSLYLAILFVFIPAFLFFELVVVLPSVCEKWSVGYVSLLILAAFLLPNIIGNLIFGMMTNTSIKGRLLEPTAKNDWTLCAVCECMRPPRAWHCDTCNICVLKRDHHCTFMACCIGYYNHRYFMLFVFHLFIAMIVSLCFNIQFLVSFVHWNHGLILVKLIFPLASFVLGFDEESIYIFMVVVNVLITLFSGFLTFYHLDNILNGKTTPERKMLFVKSKYSQGLVPNLVEVFGFRWYLTWISPFVQSPLPGNGVEWLENEKYM